MSICSAEVTPPHTIQHQPSQVPRMVENGMIELLKVTTIVLLILVISPWICWAHCEDPESLEFLPLPTSAQQLEVGNSSGDCGATNASDSEPPGPAYQDEGRGRFLPPLGVTQNTGGSNSGCPHHLLCCSCIWTALTGE